MWADRLQKQESRPGGRAVAIFLYNLAILLILPVAIAFLAVQLLVHRRYRESLLARLGFLPRSVGENHRKGPVFWIHAVSVGEVVAVSPLVRRLRQCFPNGRLVVSTITETGQATARQRIPEADEFIYFPFDLRWIVGKVIRVIRPSLFVFLETEIWPNFLFALAQQGIPSVMVN
ncbi:MAG: 3-deoxy-D-manno-octulosonic acid transferase, partial [Nitrospiria bacterium]